MSDLEASIKRALYAGLSTGHADSYSDLVDELLSQVVELRGERDGLSALLDVNQQVIESQAAIIKTLNSMLRDS